MAVYAMAESSARVRSPSRCDSRIVVRRTTPRSEIATRTSTLVATDSRPAVVSTTPCIWETFVAAYSWTRTPSNCAGPTSL